MTWTTTPPTVPGWYWLRTAGDARGEVVRVARDPDGPAAGLAVYRAGYELDEDFPAGAEWAGPLTPPETPA